MISPDLLRRFPLDSRFFGPPRRQSDCAGYARPASLRAHEVAPAAPLPPPRPLWFGSPAPGYLPPEEAFPARQALSVFSLSRGRVLGPGAVPVAPGDYMLEDFAWRQPFLAPSFEHSGVLSRRRPYPTIRLRGRVALLASSWSVGGFGHFCTDALPRWRLLLDAGHAPEDFAHILTYSPNTAASRALLDTLGLGSRLLAADPSVDYACDELVFTTYPHLAPRFTPRLLEFIRDLRPPRSAGRRVYLSRAGYKRHPGNAPELEPLLKARGFETISADDHRGAIDACREADIVVGVEGSNLINTLFCPPGARIVVLLWPGCPFAYIPGIGAALGHPVGIVAAARGSDAEAPVFPSPHVADALDWALTR